MIVLWLVSGLDFFTVIDDDDDDRLLGKTPSSTQQFTKRLSTCSWLRPLLPPRGHILTAYRKI